MQGHGTRDDDRPWHALAARAALAAMDSRPEGLEAAEAEERLARHGANSLPAPARRGPLRRLLAQFGNVLILVLVAAAVIMAALGEWLDAAVILAVVVVNTVVGFAQEGRAEQALDAIRHMLAPRASVRRAGKRQGIAAEDLVPGDVVLLEAGDRVPADLRLIESSGLRVEESALTGESVAVDKRVEPVDAGADLGDRASMAWSGTVVAAGQGVGVAVATGAATELGRISGLVSGVEALETPLLEQMSVFARRLTLAILLAAVVLFAWGLFATDRTAGAMFMIVVSLAVASIPEGLPATLTITLAIGVQRMAARNAIIRRLPSVETLGAVSIICTDKTGTLTRNEMTARTVALADRTWEVGGTGYAPTGAWTVDGAEAEVDAGSTLAELLRAGVLCNESSLSRRDGTWQVSGDPMEGALLVAASKGGVDPAETRRRFVREDVIPFDSGHLFMAVRVCDEARGTRILYIKGAPERVLAMCDRERRGDRDVPLDAEAWHRRGEEIAARGQRLLALAVRPAPDDTLDFDDVSGGVTLLGVVGFIDPPREEAIAAIAECRSAGIDVKMITGDHAATAGAIGRQLGLSNSDELLTGNDLHAMEPAAFDEAARRVDIFARTTPEHKLRLVESLQAGGDVVAMTGDGVNDAPALHRADVGVAMGLKGTEAAKEAADMVLADDNFASIAHAVREGRTVYDNLRKAILFLLPVNGGEASSIVVAVLFGLTLPITPVQILWVNMVSAVGLSLTIAFEPPEPDIMDRPPRRRGEPLLSRTLVWRIAFVSLLFLAGIFGMFYWSLATGSTLEAARTHAANTLVALEVFYLFHIRYLGSGSLGDWSRLFGTRIVWTALTAVTGLQLLFTYAPFMNTLFETEPVDLRHGAAIVAVGVTLLAILELEKRIRDKVIRKGESKK